MIWRLAFWVKMIIYWFLNIIQGKNALFDKVLKEMERKGKMTKNEVNGKLK
jgi:hypothetical protein